MSGVPSFGLEAELTDEYHEANFGGTASPCSFQMLDEVDSAERQSAGCLSCM